jgi:hypothetical protein
MRAMILAAMVAAAAACGVEEEPEPEPITQSEACAKAIACEAYYVETIGPAPGDTSAFGADGDCWQSEQRAAECTDDCIWYRLRRRLGLQGQNKELGACEVSEDELPER